MTYQKISNNFKLICSFCVSAIIITRLFIIEAESNSCQFNTIEFKSLTKDEQEEKKLTFFIFQLIQYALFSKGAYEYLKIIYSKFKNSDEEIIDKIIIEEGVNESFKNYIKNTVVPNFRKKKNKFSSKFEKLNIDTPDCLKCPISLDVPNIPALVGGKLYDYESIILLKRDKSGYMINPETREQFNLNEIQPAYRELGEIKKLIQDAEKNIVSSNNSKRNRL